MYKGTEITVPRPEKMHKPTHWDIRVSECSASTQLYIRHIITELSATSYQTFTQVIEGIAKYQWIIGVCACIKGEGPPALDHGRAGLAPQPDFNKKAPCTS